MSAFRFNCERMRQLRLEHGWTQETLAEKLGVDVSTVRNYESGRINRNRFKVRDPIRALILKRLEKALEVAPGALLEAADPLPAPSPPRALPAASLRRTVLLSLPEAAPDATVASQLETLLTRRGHQVWSGKEVSRLGDFALRLEAVLEESEALIVLISATSATREDFAHLTRVAVEQAQRRKLQVIPIQLEETGPLPRDLLCLSSQPALTWEYRTPSDTLEALLIETLEGQRSLDLEGDDLTYQHLRGALPLDSPYYLVRRADAQFRRGVDLKEGILRIEGSRQTGKTSLLARGLEYARSSSCRVVFTDLQALNATQLEDPEPLLRAFANSFAEQLPLELKPEAYFRPEKAPNESFSSYLLEQVLRSSQNPLVWALDEVDRLVGTPVGTDLFGLFRAFYSRRAIPHLGTPWRQLTLVLCHASEPHLFIENLDQSPFNVGVRLALEDFTPEMIAELDTRHGGPLRSPANRLRFTRLVGGHPYLVQCGLSYLQGRQGTLADLEDPRRLESGPFGDHLRRLLLCLLRSQDLSRAVKAFSKNRTALPSEAFYRLRAAGVVTGLDPEEASFRCTLYQTYFERHLP